ERGAGAFQELLDRAQPLVDYVFDRALAAHEAGRPEDKARVVREVAPWWASLDSAVARSDYVRRFAERLGGDEAALRSELTRLVGRRRRGSADRSTAVGGNRNRSPVRPGRLRAQGGRSIHPAAVPPAPGPIGAERELVRALVHE